MVLYFKSHLSIQCLLKIIFCLAAEATLDEVIDAAKKAMAHEFILQLKDGYDTVLGKQGHELSSGQKQRISIAKLY